MKVLFISAWYPNRANAMTGLFVQKHAEAMQLYDDVRVVYVHPNTDSKTFEIVEQRFGDLQEIIVYYPVFPRSFFYKFLKVINYVRAYWKGYHWLKNNHFIPDIVHANVLTRTGFIAYLYKKWKGTPYVITEHWSRYLPQNPTYTGYFRKKLTQIVVKQASAVLPVSVALMQAMQNHRLHHPQYEIVYNVVDEEFFQEKETVTRNKKRVLHVSCFSEQTKNVKGILRATRELLEQRTDVELILVGTGPDFADTYNYAKTLDFPTNTIAFIGEQTPVEVAEWFRQSDVFVLFSNYETAGVVTAESLASGVPVIATPTGIALEVINASNGLIVDFQDELALQESIRYILEHTEQYDARGIRSEARKQFCSQVIGQKIHHIYQRALR